MKRHGYLREPGRATACVCGKDRNADVHTLMVWRRSVRDGCWYSGLDGVAYRCRPAPRRRGAWWPEFLVLEAEDWQPVGDGIAVTYARARTLCEEYREAREQPIKSPLVTLADRWDAAATQLYADYPNAEDCPHTHGQAGQLRACAYELREVMGDG